MSCSQDQMPGEIPPNVHVKTESGEAETVLGTYCWKNECVDKAGPPELLNGKEPVKVSPGEKLSLQMDYTPKPNDIHFVQVNEGGDMEVPMEGNRFSAPLQKGTYHYSYGVWWMDEKEENVSHGDAFYAFALEVR